MQGSTRVAASQSNTASTILSAHNHPGSVQDKQEQVPVQTTTRQMSTMQAAYGGIETAAKPALMVQRPGELAGVRKTGQIRAALNGEAMKASAQALGVEEATRSVSRDTPAAFTVTGIEHSDRTLPQPASSAISTSGARADAAVAGRDVLPAVHDQIMRGLSARGARDEIQIQLSPRSLGTLDIKINQEAGELNLSVVAREAPTREMLEQLMPRIRQSLQDLGLSVGAFEVGEERTSQREQSHPEHRSAASEEEHPGFSAPESQSPERGFHIAV